MSMTDRLGTLYSQEQLHDNLWKITLLLERACMFKPGQYAGLTTLSGHRIGIFSFASAPFALPKVVLYTRHALACALGDFLIISPEKGDMCFSQEKNDTAHYILCAGGTGITPFLSLITSYPDKNWQLYWSIRQEEDLFLLKDLSTALKKKIKILSYTDGDQDLYQAVFQAGAQSKQTANQLKYYIAGPFIFVEKIGQYLLDQQISAYSLFSDLKKFH